MRRLAASILALVVILGSNGPVRAEDGPPTRVGRVSFVEGKLAFHAKGETEWSAVAVNHPVATGGSFWTDPKSRAELRVDVGRISRDRIAIDIAGILVSFEMRQGARHAG